MKIQRHNYNIFSPSLCAFRITNDCWKSIVCRLLKVETILMVKAWNTLFY